jgi:hypothetical protein
MAKKRSLFSVPPTRRQARPTLLAMPTDEEPAPSTLVMYGTFTGTGGPERDLFNIACGACGAFLVEAARPDEVVATFYVCPRCETTLKFDSRSAPLAGDVT